MYGGIWGFQPAISSLAHVSTPNDSGREASKAKRNVELLEMRLDKLTLINMALWSLLQEVGNFTEEDLLERVAKIDLLDGKADGKVTKQVKKCPKCSRVMSPRHARCLYCGATKLDYETFDSVL